VEGKRPYETRQPVQYTMVPIPAVVVCEISEMVKIPLLIFGRGFIFL